MNKTDEVLKALKALVAADACLPKPQSTRKAARATCQRAISLIESLRAQLRTPTAVLAEHTRGDSCCGAFNTKPLRRWV